MITETEELKNKVLFSPAVDLGCNELRILSGYASPAMVDSHINSLTALNCHVKIDLTLGMVPADDVTEIHHKRYLDLMKNNDFVCRYIMKNRKPCHSKVYLWSKDGTPVVAFSGSANYSQNAFMGVQREVLTECNIFEAEEYIDQISGDTIICDHDEVEEAVRIVSSKQYIKHFKESEDSDNADSVDGSAVKLSLLKQKGGMPTRSGLNWGQRPGRNPNQAYIPVPVQVARSGFFPSSKINFTVMTDDGCTMTCVVAQDGDKAIETPFNNSDLGLYFRKRLGLESGAFIEEKDLLNYGRTDVSFTKIDDETYFMDFSI